MKFPKFFVFARRAIFFFAVSHVMSYIISTLQTGVIIKEIRQVKKSGE